MKIRTLLKPILLAVIFFSWMEVFTFQDSISVAKLLGLVAAGTWVAHKAITYFSSRQLFQVRRNHYLLVVLLALFLSYAFVSGLWVTDVQEYLYFFQRLFFSFCLMAILYDTFDSIKDLRQIAWCLFLAGTVGGLIGLLQQASLPSILWSFQRLAGPFHSPNNTGAHIMVAFVVSFYLMKNIKDNRVKLLVLTGISLQLIAVAFTFSRISYLGLGLVLSLILAHERIRMNEVLLILCVLLLAFFSSVTGYGTFFFNRLWSLPEYFIFGERTWITGATSLAERGHIYTTTLELIKKNPLFGVGFGDYEWEIAVFDPELYIPHSLYLRVMAELGLVGLILLLAILYLSWRNFRMSRMHYDDRDADASNLVKGYEIAFIGYLFISIVQPTLFTQSLWILVVMSLLSTRGLRRAKK